MQVRFTVRGFMLIVVIASLCLAAFRLHPALGCFVSAVLCLATIRTSGAINRSRAVGSTLSTLGIARSFIGSLMVSLTILACSFLPALCLMPAFGPHSSHQTPEFNYTVTGIVISAVCAVPIAVLLRRSLW